MKPRALEPNEHCGCLGDEASFQRHRSLHKVYPFLRALGEHPGQRRREVGSPGRVRQQSPVLFCIGPSLDPSLLDLDRGRRRLKGSEAWVRCRCFFCKWDRFLGGKRPPSSRARSNRNSSPPDVKSRGALRWLGIHGTHGPKARQALACMLTSTSTMPIEVVRVSSRRGCPRHRPGVLNVAGPRASDDPEVYSKVKCVLAGALGSDVN